VNAPAFNSLNPGDAAQFDAPLLIARRKMAGILLLTQGDFDNGGGTLIFFKKAQRRIGG